MTTLEELGTWSKTLQQAKCETVVQDKIVLEKLCAFFIRHGFSTGHADTIDDLLGEIGPQLDALVTKVKD